MENYKQTKRFENIVRLAVLFLTVLVCVAALSFVRLGQARRENAKYDELIASLKEEQAKLSSDIDEVQSEEYLEEKIRNEFGMIKDGETLFIFKD